MAIASNLLMGSSSPPPGFNTSSFNTSYTPSYSQTQQPGYQANVQYIPGTASPLPGQQDTHPLWVARVADYLATAWANGWRGLPGGWNPTYGQPNPLDGTGEAGGSKPGMASAATIAAFTRYAYGYQPGTSETIDSMFPYIAPGPNDYVQSPSAIAARVAQANADRDFAYNMNRDAVSDARWQATFAAENASRQMSMNLQAQGMSMQAAEAAATQAYRMAQLALDQKQLDMQGKQFDQKMAFDQMTFAADQAIKQAQLELSKQELAIRAQEQGVKRAEAIAKFGQNPGDAVARELFLQLGAAGEPQGTPVDIFSGQRGTGLTTLSALQEAQAPKLAPFSGLSGATPPTGAVPSGVPSGATAPPPPAPAPVPDQRGAPTTPPPQFAFGGGTLAREFITGDPQVPGRPNPEMVRLETRGEPDVAHVTPMYAYGTDEYSRPLSEGATSPPPVTSTRPSYDLPASPAPQPSSGNDQATPAYRPPTSETGVTPPPTQTGTPWYMQYGTPITQHQQPTPVWAETPLNVPTQTTPQAAGPSPYDANSWYQWTAPKQGGIDAWTPALQMAGYADQSGRLTGPLPQGWTPEAYMQDLANTYYGGGNLYTNSPYGGANMQVAPGDYRWWDAIRQLAQGKTLQQLGLSTSGQMGTQLAQAGMPSAPGANAPQQTNWGGKMWRWTGTGWMDLSPNTPLQPGFAGTPPPPQGPAPALTNQVTIPGATGGAGGGSGGLSFQRQAQIAPTPTPVGASATGMVPTETGWGAPGAVQPPLVSNYMNNGTVNQLAQEAGPTVPGQALPPGIPEGSQQVGAPPGSGPGVTYWRTPSGVFMQTVPGAGSRPYAPNAPATPAGAAVESGGGGGPAAGGSPVGGNQPWYNQRGQGSPNPPPATGGGGGAERPANPRASETGQAMSGGMADILKWLTNPAGISALSYDPSVYRGLASRLLTGDNLSLGNDMVGVPQLGLTGQNALTSPAGLNLANLVSMAQNQPGAFQLLSSLYQAGNQNLGDIIARLQARAPKGNAYLPSLISTV